MCNWVLFDWQDRCNNLLWQTEGKSRKLRKTMKQNKHQTERSSDSEKGWNTKCQHESTQTKRNKSNKNGRNCIKSTRIERIKEVMKDDEQKHHVGAEERVKGESIKSFLRSDSDEVTEFGSVSSSKFTFRFNELTCRSQTFTAVFLWGETWTSFKKWSVII